MSEESQYLDKVVEIKDIVFNSEQEVEDYFFSMEMTQYLKDTYGLKIPYLFRVNIEGDFNHFYLHQPRKLGGPMDWAYFSELLPITPEVIDKEENIEKRRVLMLEYGVANYLGEVTVLHEDRYGTLIEADFEGDPQKFVIVLNATPEEPEMAAEYKKRNMLGEGNRRLYYIPVPDGVQTAEEGVSNSWDLDDGILGSRPDWDFAS